MHACNAVAKQPAAGTPWCRAVVTALGHVTARVLLRVQVGVAGNSCREDEALLRQVRCAQRDLVAALPAHLKPASADHSMPNMLIADCRPKANAVVRRRCGVRMSCMGAQF